MTYEEYLSYDEDDDPRPHPEGEGINIPLHKFSEFFREQQTLLKQQRKEREASLEASGNLLSNILKQVKREQKKEKQKTFEAMINDDNYLKHRFSKTNRFRTLHVRK
jgi:hypothetical protein